MPLISSEVQAEFLQDDEFQALSGMLTLYRKNLPWLKRLMDTLAKHYTDSKFEFSPAVFAGEVVDALDQDPITDEGRRRELTGFLLEGKTGLTLLFGSESEAVHDYALVMRGDGWLDRLVRRLVHYEVELMKSGKRLSPMEIARYLAQDAQEFENQLGIAKEMIERFPSAVRRAESLEQK